MTTPPRRLPNLPREEWTDPAREVFAFWGEPNAREEGSRTNIMMVLANHPDMAMPYNHWAKHLLMTNTLPTRALELLILRVAWRVKSAYEWHNHVGYGLNAGLTLEDIAAIRDYPEGAGRWAEADCLVLDAVDDLMERHSVSDATWEGLARHYDRRQMMDLVMSIGHYVMTSWALSSFGVPIEGDVDPIGFDLRTASGDGPARTFKPGEVDDWAERNQA
ncbi:carboxymuconolactone decarboxylase family protein [Novosphingobium profundi]|uniref:carboxymuconolactone decarboxylase family protein n=1 Tax=Novosphingobium profundi TaxID=1774954 RepID=UPI001CFCD354|nr:carboxymuconolactone decarboxylase family protein [Novosphingobium profundi]